HLAQPEPHDVATMRGPLLVAGGVVGAHHYPILAGRERATERETPARGAVRAEEDGAPAGAPAAEAATLAGKEAASSTDPHTGERHVHAREPRAAGIGGMPLREHGMPAAAHVPQAQNRLRRELV